ncbi:hypothetical protein [Erythrobacter neustonensis]|uniref:Uncharacterized protein n=1 Tax=Erythrobacter neustonensis TaxID=1112 RepID=A0A192D5F7_9SPHN|nr:hypothetical protein [Erythrobacter neustonensis]ANK13728.1 hypothetical protein A9D12_13100 [Erythrobacter neustonensis]
MTRKSDPRTTRRAVDPGELPDFAPVPRRCNRHDGWTPARQRGFIEALADTGSVEAAARAVDMSTEGAYHLRRQPGAEAFRAAWAAALDLGVQRVEDVAMDRALNGTEEPVYSYGKLIGTRIKRNDGLLMFILRNRAPERFATGGGARRLNAVDRQTLERHKKQWRKEWEAEQGFVSAADVRASIDRKIEDIRRRIERERPQRRAVLSDEALAAFAHFCSLRDRDLAAHGADARLAAMVEVTLDTPTTHFDPPAVPALPGPSQEEEAPPQHPPEGYSYGKPKPAPPPKTRWTIKDDSFEP